MNDCLVKKLKGVIADSSAPKFGDLVLNIVNGTSDFKIKVNNPNTVSDTVRLTNGLIFDGGGSEVDYTTDTILSVDPGAGNMYYPDSNGITDIILDDAGDKSRLVSNIEDWYLPSLVKFQAPGGIGLTGDISAFGVSDMLLYLRIYQTNITGSVEGLINKLRQLPGKTTGNIMLTLGSTTNVTFQGQRVTSNAELNYRWDAQGNITVVS